MGGQAVAISFPVKYTSRCCFCLKWASAHFFCLGFKMSASDLYQRQSLEDRIAGLAEQVAASMGMEVVLVEIKGDERRSIIRTYIDQPTGISLDDCERFSRRLSASLDVEDWIPFSYVLEVSSPGVNRPLIKEADFQRFSGKNAKVRTKIPIKGQRNFKGKIMGVTEGRLELEISPDEQIEIALMDIEKASLIADLSMRPQGS
jgi:ribosome maturation factor RimP